jgi:hypothetical protein
MEDILVFCTFKVADDAANGGAEIGSVGESWSKLDAMTLSVPPAMVASGGCPSTAQGWAREDRARKRGLRREVCMNEGSGVEFSHSYQGIDHSAHKQRSWYTVKNEATVVAGLRRFFPRSRMESYA